MSGITVVDGFDFGDSDKDSRGRSLTGRRNRYKKFQQEVEVHWKKGGRWGNRDIPYVVCPVCNREKRYRLSTIRGLKTPVCVDCIAKKEESDWKEVECPRCGKKKRIAPYELAKYERKGHTYYGYCIGCDGVYDTNIPDTWDAGYFVGVMLGDGSIYKANHPCGFIHIIRLEVTSEAFARKFKEVYERLRNGPVWIHSKERTIKANPSIRMPECTITCWQTGATDRTWYERLYPLKKERNFETISTKGIQFKDGFLKGIIDSEGYIHPQGHCRIAGKDTNLLLIVRQVALDLGFRSTIQGPYPYSRGVAYVYVGNWTEKTE